jgi:ABC-2 type transport system ATP-binding protein
MRDHTGRPERDPALETHGLTKRFGDRLVVNEVDLQVPPGSVSGLLGRNGAGKTTLMRMILGLLTPDSGSVSVFGHPAPAGDPAARDGVAGFVEEPRFYPYLSAQRNLELLTRLDGSSAMLGAQATLELVGLAHRSRDKVGTFSTGMRQRLGLAAALLRDPRLIVLDEPTMGLDPAGALEVRAQLRALADRGGAVLLSSHNMTEVAEICDHVLIIDAGRTVWAGTQASLQGAAPTPAYRVWTTDDEQAILVARRHALRLDNSGPSGGRAPLLIHADEEQRDAFVLDLAGAGVAVRQLEPDVPPLEALFSALTVSIAEVVA